MTALPVVIPRANDEFLYSWLLRIATANGFSLIRPFVNAYITPNASESEKSRRVLTYDLLNDYEAIYQALKSKEDKLGLFLSTSLFSYYSIFMTEDQQSAIIDEAFINNANDNYASVTHTKMTSELRLCPECMKEDQKLVGRFYYHRVHQLPGVEVCAKHGCALYIYKGIAMHEMDENPNTASITPKYADALEFAKYSAELLYSDIDVNADILKQSIRDRLQTLYQDDFELTYQAVNSFLNTPISKSEFNKLWKVIHTQRYLNPSKAVRFLMFLFPKVSDLKHVIPMQGPSDAFNKALKNSHCTMIGRYRSYVVEVQHDCGWMSCITPKEFVSCWICPNCSFDFYVEQHHSQMVTERTGDVFKREIKDLTGDEYTMVGSYIDMKHTVEIRHNKCGHIQKYKPAAFLDGSRCKYCNQSLKENQLAAAIQSLSNGRYKIVAKRTNNLYTIVDQVTGLSRDMSASKILGELRRPTPSVLLPHDSKGKEAIVATQINDIWQWIEQHCPKGLPIFLEDIDIKDIDYAVVKSRVRDLYLKKHLIRPVCTGVYEYNSDHLTADTVVKARYLYRDGKHIGYPFGSNALYLLDILTEKPDEYRIVTNKETAANTSGRTTKFMGHKLRIKGSNVDINDTNWQVLMILDTAVNIRKYMHGGDTHKAYQMMANYVKNNHIMPEDFSKYQDRYAFSYNAVRELYKGKYAQIDIPQDKD